MEITINMPSDTNLQAFDASTGDKILDPKKLSDIFSAKVISALNDVLLNDDNIKWDADKISFRVTFAEYVVF